MELFVYGTLRSGAAMHALIERDCELLGSAKVRARLLDLGSFPGLVDASAGDEWVHGELYRVEPRRAEGLLERLDRYEGEDFERGEDHVEDASGQRRRVVLYRYIGPTRSARPVAAGDWLAHIARRP